MPTQFKLPVSFVDLGLTELNTFCHLLPFAFRQPSDDAIISSHRRLVSLGGWSAASGVSSTVEPRLFWLALIVDIQHVPLKTFTESSIIKAV